MKSNDINVLESVFLSVLEREAFMFGSIITKDDSIPGDNMQKADLSFKGTDAKGTVSITLPESLSLELAANILGADPDEEFVKKQSHDALGELLNVLCGQFLTTVEGGTPVFDLSVPKVYSIDDEQWKKLITSGNTLVLMVDDQYPVLLELVI